MRVNQSSVIEGNYLPSTSQQQPGLRIQDRKTLLDLIPNKSDVIYSANGYDSYSSTSPESSTTSRCSSVIQFAPQNPCRPEVVVLKRENSEESQEATEKTLRDNPVMPFTLEEEFKVIDFIVRIEDYLAKRFIFIDKNFGDSVFPEYKKFTAHNAFRTNMSGMLPYNPVMEDRLFSLALKFTQLNINQFYNEMQFLSDKAKLDMLSTSFPSTYVIFYAILENNNAMQPLSLGREKVRNIRMRDMERFTSPWALDYADEVKFNNTVQRVGEVLGSDMKLQALYHMLVMVTPYDRQVCL